MIEYILVGYEKSRGFDDLPRTVISPDAGKSEMKMFFDKVLNVTNSPRYGYICSTRSGRRGRCDKRL